MKKILIGLFFILIVSILLFNYISFTPENSYGEKVSSSQNTNFTENNLVNQQFYPNMRYSDSKISYKIENCSLAKKNNFEDAIKIISNKTVLSFYQVNSNPEILVSCSEKQKVESGFFIAGEGGPTKAIQSGKYYVILNGEVLLIKDSQCLNPNIAIHETLHALGFEHSTNKNNIIYNISSCDQEIGIDTINLIDSLYQEEGLPDLSFEDVSAKIHDGYLDANMSIRNIGLKDANESRIIITVKNKEVKEINVSELLIGEGILISLQNIKINQKSIDNVTFFIEDNFKELDKENNLLILKMNKLNNN